MYMIPTVTGFVNGSPVRPSNNTDLPDVSTCAFVNKPLTSDSRAPSNTGVPTWIPFFMRVTICFNDPSSAPSIFAEISLSLKIFLISLRAFSAFQFSRYEPICFPRLCAAQPKCTSRICPMFIREGTPSGFRTMSTGEPSARYGMSSTGNTLETTPLLPWRPANLSPTCILRLIAT
ncbi:hypothetical protein D3C87_1550200 [compost metagenome]